MPRTSRVVLAKYPHHIIQRGHNKQVVFAATEDYEYYFHNLKEWKKKLGCKIYAYCLIANHIHLIIDPGAYSGVPLPPIPVNLYQPFRSTFTTRSG